MFQTIVVLADGETWTLAHKCEILVIPESEVEALMDGTLSLDDVNPVAELELIDHT